MSTPESENNRDEYTPPPGAPRWWRREDSSLVRFAAGTVTRFAVGCVLPIAAIVYFVFPYIKELSESSNRPRPPQEAPVVQEEGVVSQPEEEPPAPPKEEYRRPPLLPFKDCEHALDLEKGWSPERSRKLGASSLVALNSVIDQLR